MCFEAKGLLLLMFKGACINLSSDCPNMTRAQKCFSQIKFCCWPTQKIKESQPLISNLFYHFGHIFFILSDIIQIFFFPLPHKKCLFVWFVRSSFICISIANDKKRTMMIFQQFMNLAKKMGDFSTNLSLNLSREMHLVLLLKIITRNKFTKFDTSM